MTDERTRQDPAEFMQRLLAEAEVDRLAALPPEQLRKELDDAGIPPGWGQNLMREALAKLETVDPRDVPGFEDPPATPDVQKERAPTGGVVRLDERRRARADGRTFALLAAAAIILLVIGVVWRKNPTIRERIDAWFSPKPTAPIPTQQPPPVPPTHEETPQEKAARLRAEAFVDVDKWYFDEAWDKLQDAKELDPTGDADPEVQAAYKAIAAGYPKPTHDSAKPPIRNNERPLQRH